MPSNNKKSFEPGKIEMVHQFEALFNHATIGIVVTNSEGQIVNFNNYAERQFGYSREELLGKYVEVLIPAALHARHMKYREAFYKHPEPREMGAGRDLFGRKKDGSDFPVEVSLSHYEIEGHPFVIAFIVDITVRKKHESVVVRQKEELEQVTEKITKLNSELEGKVEDRTKMLRETLAELERSKNELTEAYETEKELSELKSRFVTMASHEFRTPLSTILSSAYLLQKYTESNGNQKMEKHLQRIKGAVAGMKSILEDFLSLGKLEEGLIQTNPELLTYERYVEELTNVIQEMQIVQKPGQQILLDENGSGDVFIDKQLLRNILLNLLSNAIKFSPENSTIKITSTIEGDMLTISVQDNGIGISEEDQQHLFERFFRAKNASNIQGTGLGLNIISKYLELMNGTISFNSKLNEGTTFTLHLPKNNNQ
jgi:PAS domain S-box-containing protein